VITYFYFSYCNIVASVLGMMRNTGA